jgi:nucleotide-binding universal stress UspA family protein
MEIWFGEKVDVMTSKVARKFMVVVDDTPECRKALRFAIRRGERTDGVIKLLSVLDAPSFEHWLGVKEMIRDEARADAEALLSDLADEIHAVAEIPVEYVIREGRVRDEVLAELDEDKDIRILVLGAATDGEGPGPLVVSLAGELSGGLRVPISIVPGHLTDLQIDELT